MSTMRNALKLSTNAKVLAAAATLFRERGFQATTVRDIAFVADVSVGTVMSAGDKSALLVRIFDEGIGQLHRGRTETLGDPSNLRCADHIFELLQPFVLLFAEDAALARTYAAILVQGNHVSRVFTELAEVLKGEIREAVSVRNGGCAVDPAQRAEAVYFSYIGILFTWSAAVPDDEKSQALLQQLHDTLATFCSCKKAAK